MNKKQTTFFVCFQFAVMLFCIGLLFYDAKQLGPVEMKAFAEEQKIQEREVVSSEPSISDPQVEPSVTQNSVEIVRQQDLKLSSKKVYLDAGHGGSDAGNSVDMTSYVGQKEYQGQKITEKEVAFGVTKRVGELLAAQGIEVVYLRKQDVDETLEERAKSIKEEDVLTVSIHVAMSEDPMLHGITIKANASAFAGREEDAFYSILESKLKERTKETVVNKSQGGCQNALLEVVQKPCVQISVGYLSNAQDQRLLTKEKYRQTLAEGICEGICQLIKEN